MNHNITWDEIFDFIDGGFLMVQKCPINMSLINRGRPNEHPDTICMLNRQGIARFMVAIFIFLQISMSFCLSI
jgi:hypothetical protein